SVPFATYTLTQALAVGSVTSENITLALPSSACSLGDMVTIKVQQVTSAGAAQCVCSPSSYAMVEVLPVQLSNFMATVSGCRAIVNWQAEDDKNISHYELQFSADGSDYSPAAIIMSNNDEGTSKYSYPVNQPSAMGYYRLKIFDNSGRYAISNIIMVHTQCDNKAITLYPNPTRDWFTVSGLQSGDLIKLYSTAGQLLIEKTASNNKEQIDLSSYPMGVYNVIVISKNSPLFSSKVQKND
ncbi:MAG TPA: T9SS type A sorting domain-containing protein, partial [Puia sp.]|nr:T9SS type A sorting domain-containing protein [Puia sp.]